MYTNLKSGEKLFYENNANLMESLKAIGGKLFATNLRLIFESGSLDLETGFIEIPLEEIKEVKLVNTLVLIPNGIELKLKCGSRLHFAVWKRKELQDLILKMILVDRKDGKNN